MTWRGVVWGEAGNYGAVRSFEPQEDLGRHTFPWQPQPNDVIEVSGQEWIVVSVDPVFITVRPRVIKALD